MNASPSVEPLALVAIPTEQLKGLRKSIPFDPTIKPKPTSGYSDFLSMDISVIVDVIYGQKRGSGLSATSALSAICFQDPRPTFLLTPSSSTLFVSKTSIARPFLARSGATAVETQAPFPPSITDYPVPFRVTVLAKRSGIPFPVADMDTEPFGKLPSVPTLTTLLGLGSGGERLVWKIVRRRLRVEPLNCLTRELRNRR